MGDDFYIISTTFLFNILAFNLLEMCIIKNRNTRDLTNGDQLEHTSFWKNHFELFFSSILYYHLIIKKKKRCNAILCLFHPQNDFVKTMLRVWSNNYCIWNPCIVFFLSHMNTCLSLKTLNMIFLTIFCCLASIFEEFLLPNTFISDVHFISFTELVCCISSYSS